MLDKVDKIYLACGFTDMRSSIDGLVSIVSEKFKLSPYEKAWFVFCNKSKDRIKILTWEDNGFWLYFKRLEKGTFMWPTNSLDKTSMNLSYEDLKHIIESPGLKQRLKGTNFKVS